MKAFVVFAAVVAAVSANPGAVLYSNQWNGAQVAWNGAPVAWNGAPVAWNGAAVAYSSPVVSQAIVAPSVTKTQYHAQDELGQASYGYAHPGQAHAAVRDAAGNVRGSYAYVNPEGKEVRVEYVADGAGFRVASNALPVGPSAGPVVPVTAPLAAPLPVADTPEVIQARAAHLQAHALARAGRQKRGVIATSVLPAATYGYSSVINHPVNTLGYSALTYNTVAAPVVTSAVHAPVVTAYSSPVVAAAPAVHVAQPLRHATLTKVVNTPGHAVSYRVD